MFPKVCVLPTTPEEILETTRLYAEAGVPGCIGSIDATHVKWNNCPMKFKQYHSGRYGFPTRSYQVVVNHKRQCLSVSGGYYGSMNDKSTIRSDPFVSRLLNKKIYENEVFDLYDHNGIAHEHKGLYLISDNGYHKWRCLQSPMKTPVDRDIQLESTWTSMVESLRKDVECFFGAIKKRFTILYGNMRIRSAKMMDDIFRTCCALHNELLIEDGLDDWSDGVPNSLQGAEIDGHDDDDVGGSLHPALQRIYERANQNLPRVVDEDLVEEKHDDHFSFKRALIVHFSYLWSQRRVKWPTRNSQNQTV